MHPEVPWLPPRVGFTRATSASDRSLPVGLLSLAASARAHGAEPVLLGEDPASEAAPAPDLLVVDATTGGTEDVRQRLADLADRYPRTDLCLATGSGRDLDVQLATEARGLRYVLRGEAEPTLGELLGALRNGRREFRGVRGLDWRDASGVVHREPDRPLGITRTGHPEPAWDLAPPALRTHVPRGFAPWLTSWSCPPSCPTCHGSFGRSVQVRDRDQALTEASRLLAGPARGLAVLDEVFDHDPQHAKALLRGLVSFGTDTPLVIPQGVRAEWIDAELAGLLYDAGLRRVDVRVEAASPRLQPLLRAHRDIDATVRSVGHLTAAGIFVRGLVEIGAPGEDEADRRHARAFAHRAPFHIVRFVPASPHAATGGRAHALPSPDPRVMRRARRWATWTGNLGPRRVGRALRWCTGVVRDAARRTGTRIRRGVAGVQRDA